MDDILTLDELCAYFKIHSSTVYRLVKTGKIKGIKIGRDWRFNAEDIEAFVRNGGTGPNGKAG